MHSSIANPIALLTPFWWYSKVSSTQVPHHKISHHKVYSTPCCHHLVVSQEWHKWTFVSNARIFENRAHHTTCSLITPPLIKCACMFTKTIVYTNAMNLKNFATKVTNNPRFLYLGCTRRNEDDSQFLTED